VIKKTRKEKKTVGNCRESAESQDVEQEVRQSSEKKDEGHRSKPRGRHVKTKKYERRREKMREELERRFHGVVTF